MTALVVALGLLALVVVVAARASELGREFGPPRDRMGS